MTTLYDVFYAYSWKEWGALKECWKKEIKITIERTETSKKSNVRKGKNSSHVVFRHKKAKEKLFCGIILKCHEILFYTSESFETKLISCFILENIKNKISFMILMTVGQESKNICEIHSIIDSTTSFLLFRSLQKIRIYLSVFLWFYMIISLDSFKTKEQQEEEKRWNENEGAERNVFTSRIHKNSLLIPSIFIFLSNLGTFSREK